MRLNPRELERIVETLMPVLRDMQGVQVWLFGSQLNDSARGGDVDVLVQADEQPEMLRQRLLGWESELEEALDMPVDLVVHSRRQPPSAVVRHALATGLRLM